MDNHEKGASQIVDLFLKRNNASDNTRTVAIIDDMNAIWWVNLFGNNELFPVNLCF